MTEFSNKCEKIETCLCQTCHWQARGKCHYMEFAKCLLAGPEPCDYFNPECEFYVNAKGLSKHFLKEREEAAKKMLSDMKMVADANREGKQIKIKDLPIYI